MAQKMGQKLPYPEIVLASNNAGKLRELGALLAPLGTRLIAQSELGVSEAEEPHPTFVENALAKARHACLHSQRPALADDSGLCVPLLGGAPGVHSSRFAELAGVQAPKAERDAANNTELLARLADSLAQGHTVPAYFFSVVVLLRHAHDPQPVIAEGRWWGHILPAPQGAGGFGYDPLFYVPSAGCSAAAMSAEQKNALSHRGQALRGLLAALQQEAMQLA